MKFGIDIIPGHEDREDREEIKTKMNTKKVKGKIVAKKVNWKMNTKKLQMEHEDKNGFVMCSPLEGQTQYWRRVRMLSRKEGSAAEA